MTRTEVALLTTGSPDRVTGGYLFHRRMADAAERHGASVNFVSVPDLPLPWALTAGAARWRRAPALARADVVVVDSIAAAAAAPWLGSLQRPMLGMLHQLPGGMEGHRVARHVRASFDRWSYRQLDLLMVASDWLADQLVHVGIAPGRLRVVLPGKDVGAVPANGDAGGEERRDAFRRGRSTAALCVANWLPRKGIAELLEAVALLPDGAVTLHLVGDTAAGGRYARRVGSRIQAPDLRHRVVVHGITERHVVAAMYRSVDVFVLPSFEEPYGTVWGEAMAAGVPVLGWRAGNLPYLADDGREALMVAPGDVAALSAALERLARAPELARSMGRAAARRAEGRPTWEDTASTFFAVIEEARARHRGPPR